MTALSFLFINLLLITTIIRPCFASESDPYTFSQLFINDSAPAINFVLENKIKKVVDELNRETSQLNLSDRDYVSLLMKKLYSKPTTAELLPGGKASLDRAFIGEWEHCIIWNNCEDWPKFERIVLRPGESVYDESNYSSMLRFLAPIFKLCGVRMGADKLTHMFDDGIGKFSLWLSQNYSLDQIYAVTLRAEFELMGARFSEVASPADVEAEIAGVKFFHDLLLGKDAFLCLDTRTKSLQIQKKIDICQYVNKNFD